MEYLIKASAVIILFYLCFSMFLKKETSFQYNRWFLLIGLVIAVVFPLIVIPVYIPMNQILVPETTFIASENYLNNTSSILSETSFDWANLIPITYGIGLSFLLIQFLFQFGSLIVLLINSPKNKDGIYIYVIVKNKISPFSFFKWIVYNPEIYNNEELSLVLTHEKVHVNQLHSIDILITQLACVVFWFNPLMWLYRKEIRQNLEYIADSKTQDISKSKKQYQRLLLKTSVSNHNISLSNNFYNSSIKERIVMLQKSKSKKKNQWKYLLMLPLLACLLLSMNTENIYVETKTNLELSKNTIEFVVTKNTTDAQLKDMSRVVENKGGSLIFTKIERNAKNELTNIFVKLYNHSYATGNNKTPLDSFIIYKELYGLGGGYVGRINGATLHFDNYTNDQKLIDALKERAYTAIIKNGVESAQVEEPKHPYIKHVEIIFNKNITDKQLEDIKQELKSNGVAMIINQISRNNKNEIIDIDIDFIAKNGSANYNVKDENGINPFYFKMDDVSFGVGALQNEEIIVETIIIDSLEKSKPHKTYIYKNEGEIYSTDSTQLKLYQTQRAVVIDRIKKKIESNDTIYFNTIDSVEIKKLSKLKSNIYYETDKPIKIITEHQTIHQPGINESTISRIKTETDEPIFIINGKVVKKENTIDIDPNSIDQIHVIKGDKAITQYGTEGKNGVIVIDLKSDNTWTAKSDTKKSDDPWSISYGMTYVNEEDPSKNGTLVYITKTSKDFVLGSQKAVLEKSGISVKYSKVKRNKAGELISLKITLKNDSGDQTSASYKDDDGIANLEYGILEGKLVVRTSRLDLD
jgi:beta-lactamase regulating signal transducer with metallopeptidase domain